MAASIVSISRATATLASAPSEGDLIARSARYRSKLVRTSSGCCCFATGGLRFIEAISSAWALREPARSSTDYQTGEIDSRVVGILAPKHLDLFVPHPESRLCSELARGSAIVGQSSGPGRIRIYYEGNVVGAVNLNRFRDRAVQAAARMLHNYPAGYPTRAREDVDEREVVQVGSIETVGYRLDISAAPNELDWWIEPADLIDLGVIERAG